MGHLFLSVNIPGAVISDMMFPMKDEASGIFDLEQTAKPELVFERFPLRHKYCLCISVFNEGERIIGQLKEIERLSWANNLDVLLIDGGSTDGCLESSRLSGFAIRSLLRLPFSGQLSTNLRSLYAYALGQGYEGIISVDGNNKDDMSNIAVFIDGLDDGFDFIQGSRYLPGGGEENTPTIRTLGIRYLHAPLISFFSGFKFTDSTNGFRAFSRQYLLDERVRPFRNCFKRYELFPYLSVRAAQIGLRVKEVPVWRRYPAKGKIPTKISWLGGNWHMLKALILAVLGGYNPR